jgi:hypothetical protein
MPINSVKYPYSSAIEKQLGKEYPNPCLVTSQNISDYVNLVNKPLPISVYDLSKLPQEEQDRLTKAPEGWF